MPAPTRPKPAPGHSAKSTRGGPVDSAARSVAPPGPAAGFLPFARPAIDEETIAGVADVLRSGWITSGPQVKAFEAKLSEYVGGRPVRAFNSGTW